MKINLVEKKSQIAAVATALFHEITNLPDDVRHDEKKRTGIQILVREPGTDNLAIVSVLEPSDRAKFFSIEKGVRSHLKGDYASQNSENTEVLEFRGSVTVSIDGMTVQVSVSGLMGDEDVTIAIRILASIFNMKAYDIAKAIMSENGTLPPSLYTQNHYLEGIMKAV